MLHRLFLILMVAISAMELWGQGTERQYLSGRGSDDAVEWEFFCTAGRNSNVWTTIPVPSNWEFHGFGTYNYGHDPDKSSEQGQYKYTFSVPAAWSGKNVFIVFEGSMTDTEVRINGTLAGPIHQGAFYRFQYDVSQLLSYGGSNLLEATVSKMSSNSSVNGAERQADYWIFGGIFRPVYLEAYPTQYIERIAVDPKANGNLGVNVFLQGIQSSAQVQGLLFDTEGTQIGAAMEANVNAGQSEVQLSGAFAGILPWSSEYPNLYRLEISLMAGGATVHKIGEKIGFRTVEVRAGDGIYINGKKIMFKGVNRHCFWPSSGRSLNYNLSLQDALLIKSMNMNAVRNAHYPADKHFLDICDSLGLYVLDELAGWQAPPYDTEVGRILVKEMLTFNVNHPSIIFWNNGNEGGWNPALDGDFALWDPQNRTVLHPWANFNNVNTDHYESYSSVTNILGEGNIYMPTEFLHGLYDGGHGAGLEDYWSLMKNTANSAGGFLWVFSDEGAVRTDQNGAIDVKGNAAPDGIVGPYRELEGSYYTIRDLWSPIQIPMASLPEDFTGTIPLENHFDFTDLSEVEFRYQLAGFNFFDPDSGSDVLFSGTANSASITPNTNGTVALSLPADWQSRDALYLQAFNSKNQLINEWSWMIKTPSQFKNKYVLTSSEASAVLSEDNGAYIVSAGGCEFTFSKTGAQLSNVIQNGQAVSFANGPNLASGEGSLTTINGVQEGNDVVITATFSGDLNQIQWRVLGNGWLNLSYAYSLSGNYAYYGMSFDYPETKVQRVQWLGKGPSRVWKNRGRGPVFNLWNRDYNDAITGQVWEYPEFKGYFSNLYWARLHTEEGLIHMVVDSPDLYLRLFSAKDGVAPQTTAMSFPEGDISLLHGIAPIGTKFLSPAALGPQGRPHSLDGSFEASVSFYFGTMEDVPTSLGDVPGSQPLALRLLSDNWQLYLKQRSGVKVELVNTAGQKIQLLDKQLGSGLFSFPLPLNLRSGVYFPRLWIDGVLQPSSKWVVP